VITSFPLPKKEAGRLNTLVNFQLIFTLLNGQFSADDNTKEQGANGRQAQQKCFSPVPAFGRRLLVNSLHRQRDFHRSRTQLDITQESQKATDQEGHYGLAAVL